MRNWVFYAGIIAIISSGIMASILILYGNVLFVPSSAPIVPTFPNAGNSIVQQNSLSFIRANSGQAIAIKWNPVTTNGNLTINQFNIYRGTISGYETLIGNADPTQSQFLDATVTPGQLYYYYVTAVLSNGQNGIIAPEIMIQD